MHLFNKLGIHLLFAGLIAGCTTQIPDKSEFNLESSQSVGESGSMQTVGDYEYLLQPGDTLRLEFVVNESLNRDILIRPDGWITTPLVDDTRAGGQTLGQLRTTIQEKYETVLHDPVFSLILTSTQPQFVYVGGELANGGSMLPYQPRLTVQQAIISAGGVNMNGELRGVFVVRDVGIERPEFLLSVLWDSETGQFNDFYLQPKDIVFVPSSAIADANKFVEQYINKLIPFSKSIGVSYTFGEYSFIR